MKLNGSLKIKRLKWLLAAIALPAFIWFCLTGSASSATTGWYSQIVDGNTQHGEDLNDLGYDTSLEFDGSNTPHISYYDEKNKDLKYATWEQYIGGSGHWVITQVDTNSEVGKYTSVDASGKVRISYYDNTNKNLKFASKNTDGTWTKVIIDNGGGSSRDDKYDVGEDTSLEVGTDGKSRISYYADKDGADDLKFAKEVTSGGNCGPSNSWRCDVIDSAGHVGKYTSLAIDSNNKAHISYYDESNKRLRYATEVTSGGNCGPSNTWRCETVDSSGLDDIGEHTSIAIGPDGYPKIAYRDEVHEHESYLKFACKDAQGWHFETVTGLGKVGDVSLAIGKDGLPRVAYHDETHEHLSYALRDITCSIPQGQWFPESVDISGNVGEDNSLALKTDDSPCITYHDESNGSLKYACKNLSNPPTVTNVLPLGWITSTSTTISADYSDNSGTGINVASVAVYMDGAKRTGCTANATHVSCPVSGLAQGHHSITVYASDNAGGQGTGTGAFDVDSIAPAISSVAPSGTIGGNSATIAVYYSDSGSGINTGLVIVALNGNPLAGCTVTATSVSCPVSGLTPGAHTIGGSASDNAGNTSPISGSFTVPAPCAPAKPGLTLICPTSNQISWASYADYLARKLLVTYTISNSSSGTAYNVHITQSSSQGGITLDTLLPQSVGNIGGSGSATVTLKYNVGNASNFKTNTRASAQDECNTNYSYPY